ncbi:MAG: sugar nucleotide-binding protein, partial [Bacteroidales bacterium]
NDKAGTPTYTQDFAKNVKLLIENDYYGLYNMVCGGLTTRIGVAEALLEILDLQGKVKILKVKDGYFKDTYFAKRPRSERLINRRLNIQCINIMREWKMCLREYIKEYYKNYL